MGYVSPGDRMALWTAAAAAAGRPDLASVAPLMATIAGLESGGDPNKYNGTTSEGNGLTVGGVFIYGSAGLWQINYTHYQSLGADWFATTVPFGSDTDGTGPWADPVANAAAAVGVYISQGPTAWSTYKAALQQLAQNGNTPPGSTGTNTPPTIGGIINGIGGAIGGAIQTAENIAGGIEQGIGLELQALFGGAVSPFLRLPQSLINIGWNFSGWTIGLILIAGGLALLFAAALEDIAKDVVDGVGDIVSAATTSHVKSAVASVTSGKGSKQSTATASDAGDAGAAGGADVAEVAAL